MEFNKISKELVLKQIYGAIDEHNKINPDDLKLVKSMETIFVGLNGSLDSLGLLTLLVEIENNVRVNIKEDFSIIDEMLLGDEEGPYKNVENLAKYITKKLK